MANPVPAINVLSNTATRMAPCPVFVNIILSTVWTGVLDWERQLCRVEWDFDFTGVMSAGQHLTVTDPRPGGSTKDACTDQVGMTAAYLYTVPGTYTIRATFYWYGAVLSTVSTTVTIAADTRLVRYVDNTATGLNDGSSWANAYETYAAALAGVGSTNDIKLIFREGQVFDVSSAGSWTGSNLYVTTDNTSNRPVLRWTGANTGTTIVSVSGEQQVWESLIFRSTILMQNAAANLRAFSVGSGNSKSCGKDLLAEGSSNTGPGFDNSFYIDGNPLGQGMLYFNTVREGDTTTTFVRYSDVVWIGGRWDRVADYAGGSSIIRGHNIRVGFTGVTTNFRHSMQWFGTARLNGTASAVRWENIQYCSMYQCNWSGQVQLGFDEQLARWFQVDGCFSSDLNGAGDIAMLQFVSNCKYQIVRNNIFESTYGITNYFISSHSAEDKAPAGYEIVNYPTIVHNSMKGLRSQSAIDFVKGAFDLSAEGPLNATAATITSVLGTVATVSSPSHGLSNGEQILFQGPSYHFDGVKSVANVTADAYEVSGSSGGSTGSALWIRVADLSFETFNLAVSNNLLVSDSWNSGKLFVHWFDDSTASGNVWPDTLWGSNQRGRVREHHPNATTTTDYNKTGWLVAYPDDAFEDIPESALVSPDFRPDVSTYPDAESGVIELHAYKDYHGNEWPISGTRYSGAVGASSAIPESVRPKGIDIKIDRKYHKRLRR